MVGSSSLTWLDDFDGAPAWSGGAASPWDDDLLGVDFMVGPQQEIYYENVDRACAFLLKLKLQACASHNDNCYYYNRKSK